MKQLTQTKLASNRRIRQEDAWSTTATDTKLNTVYDTFKLILKINKIIFNYLILNFQILVSYMYFI